MHKICGGVNHMRPAIPWSNCLVPSTSLDLNAQGPQNWDEMVIGNSRMLIGTNTRSQQLQLNSYSFVFGGYECTKCKCICGGVNHMRPAIPW